MVGIALILKSVRALAKWQMKGGIPSRNVMMPRSFGMKTMIILWKRIKSSSHLAPGSCFNAVLAGLTGLMNNYAAGRAAGTRAEAAIPPSSTIWDFFLEPWPIWPRPMNSRNSHRAAGPASFLICPRFVDSQLENFKNFCYN